MDDQMDDQMDVTQSSLSHVAGMALIVSTVWSRSNNYKVPDLTTLAKSTLPYPKSHRHDPRSRP